MSEPKAINCVYGDYEPACGMWCKNKRCYAGKNCPCEQFSPNKKTQEYQATLNLINRLKEENAELKAENERLKEALVDNLEAYKDGFNEGAGLKKGVDDKLKTENQQLKAENDKYKRKLTTNQWVQEIRKETASDIFCKIKNIDTVLNGYYLVSDVDLGEIAREYGVEVEE